MVTLHETHLQLGQWTTLKMYLKLLTLPNLLYKKFSPPPPFSQSEKALTPPPFFSFPPSLFFPSPSPLLFFSPCS